MPVTSELTPLLRKLRLSGVLETLEVRNRQAIDERLSYVEFMSILLQDESERREQKKLVHRIRRGGIDVSKTLEVFDFEWNTRINRRQWFDLATCRFVEAHENVLLVGPTGVGKSHLALALANEACRKGYDVLVSNAAKLLARLNGGRADGTYDRRMTQIAKADLIVMDDWGLLPLRPPGSEDLYQIIAERYERGSMVITSNRSFEEWPTMFAEPLLASAALDRLRHHAHVIEIVGRSYRDPAASPAHVAEARCGTEHKGVSLSVGPSAPNEGGKQDSAPTRDGLGITEEASKTSKPAPDPSDRRFRKRH